MLSILRFYILKIVVKSTDFLVHIFLPGKKGKKKKCKTVDLMSFLADGGGTPTVPVKPLTSWIDEMEEEHGKIYLRILLASLHFFIFKITFIFEHLCIYIHVCIYIYTCMYVRMYIHACTHARARARNAHTSRAHAHISHILIFIYVNI